MNQATSKYRNVSVIVGEDNFKKTGVRGPEAVEFLGSLDCFDATLHALYFYS